ncbi:hypothetical protein SJAG_00206 [Schizosaccharomyces japonicus yFS275]|uniref:Uncharacterized protein n=1 Tax=Schizosaccharomyces japonicus (strain yFS275 / FY16936) TaxID=402676 RepID=B6JV06_SCHJY|nr:hypothetical protein SJAG_00206 [Schizosaccharomyces japonicus yFS275]EEB05207.1 hypothetical protein SJAG_00206 [Schizosaccharomyces japonicus yFS275]
MFVSIQRRIKYVLTKTSIRRRRLELSNESRYSIEEMNELKSSVKETPKDYIMTNEKESVIVNQLPNDQLNKETITNNVPTSISSEVSRMIDQGLPEEYIVKEMKERKIRRQNIAMTEDNYISLETGDALYIPLKENKSLLQREDDVLDNGYGDYEAMIEDGLVITDQQKQQEAKLKEECIENAAEQIVESENNVDWGSWEAAQVRKGVYNADQQEMLRKQNRPQLAKIPTLQEQIQRLRTCIAEEKLQQDERMKQLESVLAEEREIANREQMLRDSFKALDDLSKSHIAQLNV